MLLCTISVFAANAAGTYTGRLTISVDGNAPTVKDGQNVIVTESDIVTLTIPYFSYSSFKRCCGKFNFENNQIRFLEIICEIQ